MKVDRVRPLVAFLLVAMLCAVVLVAGMQDRTLTLPGRGPLSPEPNLQAPSSVVLGSVLTARIETAPLATDVAHAVSVVVLHRSVITVRAGARTHRTSPARTDISSTVRRFVQRGRDTTAAPSRPRASRLPAAERPGKTKHGRIARAKGHPKKSFATSRPARARRSH